MRSLVLRSMVENFDPLVHLDFALKPVAVLRNDSKVAIAQVGVIVGRARDVH